MKQLRIGIVGAGVIGKRHLAAINNSDKAHLVGIADPFAASESVARDAGVAHYASSTEMLAELHPDGVIVATPTEHHLQPTLDALDSGAGVLVEKPVTATTEEARLVIEKSQQTQRPVLVGHQRRYYAQVDKTRELIQSGALGQLVAVHGQWNVRKNDSYYEADWRKKWQAGPVLTNLIHEIDILRYICGEIKSITAETSHSVNGFEKEDAAGLLMRFESGALGTFSLSDQTLSPWGWEFATGENAAFPRSEQNAIRFMGTKASLDFPNHVLWHAGEQSPDWTSTLQSESSPFVFEDAYISQIEHFCAVIRGEVAPISDARDAARSLRATLAVYDSADSGCRVVF